MGMAAGIVASDYDTPVEGATDMDTLELVRQVLAEALQLGDAVQAFDRQTPLLGALPELDSMGVIAVITLLEQQYGISIPDDEIDAESFESVGSLADLIDSKRG